jgi:hypothetical protein
MRLPWISRTAYDDLRADLARERAIVTTLLERLLGVNVAPTPPSSEPVFTLPEQVLAAIEETGAPPSQRVTLTRYARDKLLNGVSADEVANVIRVGR